MGASLCYKKNLKEKLVEEYYDYNSNCSLSLTEKTINFEDIEFGTITNSKVNKKRKLCEFEIIKKIGVGSFGVVYLSHENITKKEYAIKCVNKSKVLNGAKNAIEHLHCEIEIMQKLNSKHILKLKKIYQDQTNYYLIVDYCNKGDFVNYLKNLKKNHLEEREAIFFLNQIKDAFIVLRKNNILHRDIKLENLFIHNRILKIGDFGFSKITEDFASSKLGSKFSMAPEIILNLSNNNVYDYKCDLWSIGCVFYEMLFGKRFLFDKINYNPKSFNINIFVEKVRNYQGFFKFPRKVSVEVQDLLRKLLVKDKNNRISFLEFISHPVFSKNNENFNINNKRNFSLRKIQPISSRNKQFISYRKI